MPLYSGSLNLVIGYLIGPHGFNLFSEDIIGKLYVLVGLVLGWAGFLIGLQAKFKELKRFQSSYYFFSTFNFLLTFIGMFTIVFILNLLLNLSLDASVLILTSILGTVSSPILIGLLKVRLKLRGQFIHILEFSAALDNMYGVVAFGIVMLFLNKFFYISFHFIILILGSIIISAFMAWLFFRMSRLIDNLQQFFLVLIGFLLILVGISLNLNISMLLIAFIFGVVLTNLPVDTRKLYQSIASAEKPLYYLMMIFIGASISNLTKEVFIIVILLVFLRITLKYLSGYISRLPFVSVEKLDARIGLPQIGMGGIALAMALDFHLSVMNDTSQAILVIVSLMSIANVLIATAVFKMLRSK